MHPNLFGNKSLQARIGIAIKGRRHFICGRRWKVGLDELRATRERRRQQGSGGKGDIAKKGESTYSGNRL